MLLLNRLFRWVETIQKEKKKRYLYKRDNGKRSIFNNPCQPKSLCLRFTEVHEGNFCPGLTRDTEMTLEKV